MSGGSANANDTKQSIVSHVTVIAVMYRLTSIFASMPTGFEVYVLELWSICSEVFLRHPSVLPNLKPKYDIANLYKIPNLTADLCLQVGLTDLELNNQTYVDEPYQCFFDQDYNSEVFRKKASTKVEEIGHN